MRDQLWASGLSMVVCATLSHLGGELSTVLFAFDVSTDPKAHAKPHLHDIWRIRVTVDPDRLWGTLPPHSRLKSPLMDSSEPSRPYLGERRISKMISVGETKHGRVGRRCCLGEGEKSRVSLEMSLRAPGPCQSLCRARLALYIVCLAGGTS